MRTSMIFRHIIKLVFWPLILMSLFLYFRGHNAPGGGFAGGLVAGSAFALYAYAFGASAMGRRMLVPPVVWVVVGLLFAYGSGFAGQWAGGEFLQGTWLPFDVPVFGHLGTPNLFDLGVYALVAGMVALIVGELFEDIAEEEAP